MRQREFVREASPDTLGGSFTPDLVASKTWLAQNLLDELDGRSAGDIYILGSWYGNLGIFLQQAGVKFDRLVMVESRRRLLLQTQKLLEPLYRQGRLGLVWGRAEYLQYPQKEITVINTSSNDMTADWLDPVPPSTLTVIQARDKLTDPVTPTLTAKDFDRRFVLSRVVFKGQRQLEDPQTSYTRFMKIGYR